MARIDVYTLLDCLLIKTLGIVAYVLIHRWSDKQVPRAVVPVRSII